MVVLEEPFLHQREERARRELEGNVGNVWKILCYFVFFKFGFMLVTNVVSGASLEPPNNHSYLPGKPSCC